MNNRGLLETAIQVPALHEVLELQRERIPIMSLVEAINVAAVPNVSTILANILKS